MRSCELFSVTAIFVFVLIAGPVFSADLWSYYSYMGNAQDIAMEPNTLWVATGGGALKIDIFSGMLGKLTRSEGLCDNNLTCVAIGHDGTKYFGTYGYGAATYKDGLVSHFDENNSGLGSNNVQSIAVDFEGAVWFGSSWGGPGARQCAVSRLQDGIWTVFDESDPGFAGGQMNRVKVIDGVVYVCSGNGLSWFDGTGWACYTAENSPLGGFGGEVDVAVARDGATFVATMWDGLFMKSGEEWSHYPLKDELGTRKSPALTALELGISGELWIGTARFGLLCYDGATVANYTPDNSALPDNWVNVIFTAGSTVYFGTDKGLASIEAGQWRSFLLPTTVPDNWLMSISAAPDGAVWIGSYSGAARCKDGQWETFTTSNSGIVGEEARFVAASPWGDIWFGCNLANNRLADGEWTSWTREETGGMVGMNDAAFAPDGTAWFAFTNGFASFKDDVWNGQDHAFGADSYCGGVAVGLEGLIWFATSYRGVFSYDGSQLTNYSFETGDLPSNRVTDVVVGTDGTLWFALPGSGVWHFDGESWEGLTPDNSGLPSALVTALGVDAQGSLWFGTLQNGAACWDGESWTYYTPENCPIGDERVKAFAFGKDGSVWMTNRVGASVLKMMPELPDLTVTIQVDNQEYTVGDTMVVSLGAANLGEATQFVDVYVALLLPNGTLLYYPSWFQLPNPFMMMVALPPGFEHAPTAIFSHTFAHAVIPGGYVWFAALTPLGQITQRLAFSSAAWQFAPPARTN